MASVASVKVKWNNRQLSQIREKALKGVFQMAFDIRNQAAYNAPYDTGALRNTIRVRENKNTELEVVAGGSYGGFTVPYALRQEYENKKRGHYMQRAAESVMKGDYLKKYFGDIAK